MLENTLKNCAVFIHSNPIDVSSYANKHVGSHQISLLDYQEPRACLWYRDFSDITLTRITYGSKVRLQSLGLDDIFHLQIVTSGSCIFRANKKSVTIQKGDMLFLNPNESFSMEYSNDCEKIIIILPKRIILQTIHDNQSSIPKEGLRFNYTPIKLRDHRLLMKLLDLIFKEAEISPLSLSSLSIYSKLLVTKLLEIFSNNLQAYQEPIPDNNFCKMDRYISDNIKEDISADDLAQLIKVSKRTVYGIFSRYKSVTPNHYIKQKKLLTIHRIIQINSKDFRNITEIALDHGFMHLGRFSNDYRKMFGELPSETYKKSNPTKDAFK